MSSIIRQSRLLGIAMVAALVLAACAPAAAPAPAPAAPAAPAAATATPRPQVIPTPLAPLINPTPTPARSVAPAATPATASKAQYGGVLTVGHFATPPHFDVHQVNTAASLWAIGAAYSDLLQYDPHKNSEIIPDLAERWDASADAKSFTFFLRKGVKWHDGKPVTADDVVVSYNRMAFPDKATVSPRQSLLSNLSKIERVDDTTVRFTLKDPQASFIPAIANGYMAIMPKHVIDAKGDMKNDIVGTGPFKLKRYQTGIAVEVEKNPDYYAKGRPYLDGVTHYIIADWNTRYAALKAKRILMTNPGTPGLTTDMRVALEKEVPDKITTWVHVHLGNITTAMNVNIKPFDDVRVRKAVHLALDRKAG
ncbi:MAG: ABC transporter substrate-binding protein, partial [Chloroflexota bacterium]